LTGLIRDELGVAIACSSSGNTHEVKYTAIAALRPACFEPNMKLPNSRVAVALSGLVLSSLALAACSQAESHNASAPEDSVIGVLQCDDHLAQVNRCIHDKVPANRRAALTAEAHQMFTTWKEAAADPEHRATLPQACSITHEVAKEELSRYGCRL